MKGADYFEVFTFEPAMFASNQRTVSVMAWSQRDVVLVGNMDNHRSSNVISQCDCFIKVL